MSLVWSTVVGVLGLDEERPWGSFFLQYIWEFGLGMWIAEKCMVLDEKGEHIMDIKNYRWWWLIIGAVGGMGLSAFMAWNGGFLKLYNDIPSLIGYLSVALLIFKIGIKVVNRFFEWANGFSYELYLIHMLVYAVVAYTTSLYVPLTIRLTFCFVLAYLTAWGYEKIINEFKIK